MPNHVIVSTCGTSLLTNGADSELKDLLNRTANHEHEELTQQELVNVDRRARECEQRLGMASVSSVRKLSAELNGLLGFYGNQIHSGRNDVHFLIHTDTYQGEQVAKILEQWLRNNKLNVTRILAEDLNTRDLASFHHGLSFLVQWCEASLRGYQEKNYSIIFNLVGGFKSLQGFMQTLGMVYADEILYIFETGEELLRIPKLPFELELSVLDTVRNNLSVFRRLSAKGSTLPQHQVRNKGIPETLLYVLGDECELSPWGRIVWERLKRDIYSERLLESPTTKIRFSSGFKREVESLEKDRIRKINERIDDLMLYLESNQQRNPNRLDFKKLRGDPCPPATHECDAWADEAAWRIFGHYEGSEYVLDSLGKGLH
ncbi:MAG TPA: putative CRISPR-associated protein [bacterium]|nr:putative CRISPR-associated protein [bacterium]HQL64029.1 putative CRISPR-associated protein [bacterium]